MSVLVNKEKVSRAQEILDLVSGKKVVQNEIEESLKNRFTGHLASEGVSPKADGALQFVYEKLGGLVRTEAEQIAFEKSVADRKGRGSKKK